MFLLGRRSEGGALAGLEQTELWSLLSLRGGGGGGLLSPLEIGEESAMAVLERLARVLCT